MASSGEHEADTTVVEHVAPSDDQDQPRPGSRLGRFFLLERAGEGGMGVVMLAYDPELHRKVAIKLLRRATERHRARLIREAQALAQVSHPNLVHVYEVGTWRGRVFVAMEFVEGRTVTGWLEERQRDWTAILDVFLAAGEALAAAHRAGIVHRDFKPSNVLVASDDTIRVVDFGLARLSGEADVLVSPTKTKAEARRKALASVTQDGAVIGTPPYLAPEQHLGAAGDQRSDQFSFCVSLFEALYGIRPFNGTTLDELRAQKTAEQIATPPPSPVPKWLHKVILRGLAAPPSERFESMRALLDLLARRRHRRPRFAAALGVAALAGGVGALLAGRTSGDDLDSCAEVAAELERVWGADRRASVVSSFRATGLPYADDMLDEVTQRIDAYARDWKAMRTEACEATRVRGTQSDELMDLRMRCLDQRLSDLDALLGSFAGASETVVERAVFSVAELPRLQTCADADALRERVQLPDDPRQRETIEKLTEELGWVLMQRTSGNLADARTKAEEVVREAAKLGHAPLHAKALYALGVVLKEIDPVRAEPVLREGLKVAAKARDDDLAATIWIELERTVGIKLSRHDDGLSLASGTDAALDRIAADERRRAMHLSNVGTMLQRKGDYEASVKAYEKAMELVRGAGGVDDREYGVIVTNYAHLLLLVGRPEEAARLLADQIEQTRATLGRRHPDLADQLETRAAALEALGRPKDARETYEEALAILQGRPENRPRIAQLRSNLAVACHALGDYSAARLHANASVDLARELYGAEHLHVAAPVDALGLVDLAEGEPARAEARFTEALAIVTATLGRGHPVYVDVASNRAAALIELDRTDEAVKLLDNASAALERLPAAHPIRVRAEAIRAEARLVGGASDGVLPPLERAVDGLGDHNPRARARAMFALARAVHARDPSRARELATQARATFERLADVHAEPIATWIERVQ